MGDAQSSSLLAENHPSWRKFYVKFFPFEIIFFLFQFSEQLYRLLYQQYYFQHLANVSLSEQPNYTAPSHSICLNQDYIVNHTDEEKFLQLQMAVSHLNMYSELILLGMSALSSLLLGPLSDIIGRKPIIITIIIGVGLTAVTQFIVIYFNLNVYYYLLCAVFYGGFGGYGAMITVMIATINDVTSKRWLTIRIGIIESCVGLGKVVTALASNNWIQNTGCNFQPPAWLVIVVSALALICSLIIPETLSKDLRMQYKAEQDKGFKKLSIGVKIYTQPHFIGWRNYWQLWTASCIICCASFGLGAVLQILNYFLHNKPLEWSYSLIGLYGVVFSGAMALSLILVLPILVLCKLSNSFICLIGAMFAIVTNVLIATVKTNWEMFLAGGLQGMFILVYPTMRSNITKLVGPENQGSAFSIVIALQILSTIITTVVTNEIYHPQVTYDGHNSNAGIIFWVMAGAWMLTLPLIILLLLKGTPATPVRSSSDVESDHLQCSNNAASTNYGSIENNTIQ